MRHVDFSPLYRSTVGFDCLFTMLDSLLWQESRFHLNTLTMKILGWQSWLFVTVIFLIGLFFESILAGRC